jgi:Tfp pilus assembly protein PilV
MSSTAESRNTAARRGERGSSMIEVLAAVALFTIIAGGLTGAVVTNTKLSNGVRTTAAAAALAQNKIEQFRSIVTSTGVIPAALTVGTHTDGTVTAMDGSGGTFTRSWTVTSVKPGLVKVAIKIQWTTPVPGSTQVITYACTQPKCSA